MEISPRPKATIPYASEEMWWGTLGSVRPFPNFRPVRDVHEIQAALEQRDVNTLVRILTNRSNAQRQRLTQEYQKITQRELPVSLKKVLSGDLATLILGLIMPPDLFIAHRLRKAMEGLGTDEETLLEILCTRTPQQLANITVVYRKYFKRDLEKDLLSETSGDFSKLVLALLKKEYWTEQIELDVNVLNEELSSKKADVSPWIRILTSRDPNHLNKVLCRVEFVRGRALEEVLDERFGGALSGDLKLGLKILVRCIQNSSLYLAQRIQTMELPVVQGVLVSHSEEDLLKVRVAYLQATGTSLYTALQKKFKGDLLQALLAICRAED